MKFADVGGLRKLFEAMPRYRGEPALGLAEASSMGPTDTANFAEQQGLPVGRIVSVCGRVTASAMKLQGEGRFLIVAAVSDKSLFSIVGARLTIGGRRLEPERSGEVDATFTFRLPADALDAAWVLHVELEDLPATAT